MRRSVSTGRSRWWWGLWCGGSRLVALAAVVAFDPARGLVNIAVVALYLLLFTFAAFVAHAFTRAFIFGHYVMVSERQFPVLHAMVVQASRDVGLGQVPVTFVYNASGVMNAMALRLLGRRYVWLTSALIDHDTEAQVRFVIGHELGHHAFGHLDRWRGLLRLPGLVIPFLGPAYSRARELSCDRLGAYLANDLEGALSALSMLACGSARLNASLDTRAFEAQENMVPALTGLLLHIFSPYPRLTRRVQAVRGYFGGSIPARA